MKRYWNAFSSRLASWKERGQEAYHLLFNTRKSRMDHYSQELPSPQNVLDLFAGQWASQLPAPFESLRAGDKALFQDPRLLWALQKIGDLNNKRVLELGPLEGGHSYMLQQEGASVVSIEANPRAFLKCLAIKQILHLHRVEFLYGDFTKYLKETSPLNFDLVVASGVLYHMSHPIQLIAQLAKAAPRAYIWTHYYDKSICLAHPKLSPRFSGETMQRYEGFECPGHRFNYLAQGSWKSFCGGPASYSHWLTQADILAACRYFGFHELTVAHESLDHIHGPSMALLASKKLP